MNHFLKLFPPSKTLASNIAEIDRMLEDDERTHLRLLTHAIDRLIQRERTVTACTLQQQRIASGSNVAEAAAGTPLAKGTGKNNNQGKGV